MKSYFKSKILVVLILILMISVNIAFFKQISYSEVYNNPYKEDNPKLNAPDITIITPENKTYTEPMSGYYPATYGFENDITGNDPQEWNDTSGTGCDCYVVDSTDTHNKVLRLYDNSASNRVDIEVSLPYQTHGTVEYWVYGSMLGSPYDRFYAYLYDGTNPTILIVASEGIWNYGPRGETWEPLPDLPSIQADTWQHLRIHFEMGNSGYMGLGPDQFELIVDGVSSGALDTWAVGSGIDKNRFFTINEDVNQNWYIDAFGYSWHTNYNVGDNLNEGLLLSFENSTSLNWIGFSLDEQTNKTILGNFTLPMPGEGSHTIQVFGNNTLGTLFESNVRYFSVKFIQINLITPLNITYTEPMSGYYPGTYGFENDINGNNPQEWNDISGTGCDCYVVDSAGDHNKILKLYDNSDPNRADIEVSLPYQTHGTIEYWVYGSMSGSPYDRLYEYIFDGGNAAIQVITVEGTWSYGQRGGGWVLLPGLPNLQAGIWQYISIHFEMGNSGYMGLGPDQFELIVDGVSSGALDTAMVGGGIDKNKFFTIADDVNQHWYIDAFGYTGDVGYNIGDNLNEGLLLSFENSSSLDWIGYSLDGQFNKTILGNTTIPIPEDGLHTIQIFGSISEGFIYESDIVHFTINIAEDQTLPNGSEDINYILIITLIGILSLIGIVVVGIIYSRVHLPSEKPKSKRRKLKEKKEKDIIIEFIHCPFCHSEIIGGQKFCNYCGANLKDDASV